MDYKQSMHITNSDLKFIDIDGIEHPIISYREFSISLTNGEIIKATSHYPQLEKWIFLT